MGKIYLHIGLHKTATTLIQRTLSNNRRKLSRAEIYYPNYNIIRKERNYCHHALARSINSDDGALDDVNLTEFFRKLGRYTKDDCIISSEIFYRMSSAKGGVEYIAKCSEYLKSTGIPVCIVISVREQASYIDSLYREHIEQTKYTGNIKRFIRERKSWLNYRSKIDDWLKYFDEVKVINYHSLSRENLVSDFIRMVTGKHLVLENAEFGNPSMSDEWVLVRKLLNEMDISLPMLKSFNSSIYAYIREGVGVQRGAKSLLGADLSRQLFDDYSSMNQNLFDEYMQGDPIGNFEPLTSGLTPRDLTNPEYVKKAITDILEQL